MGVMDSLDGTAKGAASAALRGAADTTDALFNNRPSSHSIEIYHIPSGNSVKFKAIVTAYTDKFSSEFEEESTYGRMDPLVTFKQTKRNITLGWEIVAASIEQAQENLAKVSLLYSMLYPSYSVSENASSITTGPVFRLKWANLIGNSTAGNTAAELSAAPTAGLVGVIKGINFEPDLESAGFFEDDNQNLFPQLIKCNIDYTVFHTHPLGWKAGGGKMLPGSYPYGVAAGDAVPGAMADMRSVVTGLAAGTTSAAGTATVQPNPATEAARQKVLT